MLEGVRRFLITTEKVGGHAKVAPGVGIVRLDSGSRVVCFEGLPMAVQKVQHEPHVVERLGVSRIEPNGLAEGVERVRPPPERGERYAAVKMGRRVLRPRLNRRAIRIHSFIPAT